MSSGLHSVYLKFKEALLNFPEKQMNGRQAPPTLPSVDCVCADIFCYYKIHFEKNLHFVGVVYRLHQGTTWPIPVLGVLFPEFNLSDAYCILPYISSLMPRKIP